MSDTQAPEKIESYRSFAFFPINGSDKVESFLSYLSMKYDITVPEDTVFFFHTETKFELGDDLEFHVKESPSIFFTVSKDFEQIEDFFEDKMIGIDSYWSDEYIKATEVWESDQGSSEVWEVIGELETANEAYVRVDTLSIERGKLESGLFQNRF